jgi:hypothetical protein
VKQVGTRVTTDDVGNRFLRNAATRLHSVMPQMTELNKTESSSRNNSGDIATRIWAGLPTNWVRFLAGARDYSLLRGIETDPRAHSASYTMGTGALSPGLKRPDHSPAANAEVNNGGAVFRLPHTSSWRGG